MNKYFSQGLYKEKNKHESQGSTETTCSQEIIRNLAGFWHTSEKST